MTTDIYNVPLRIPTTGFAFTEEILPDGFRCSTDCPSRRYLEYVDPDRFIPFNEGVGVMGHLLAQVWIHNAFAQYTTSVEFEIPWQGGFAHIDCVVWDGPHAGCYEIKTTSDKDPKPKRENERQVRRMIALADKAGLDLPSPFRIVVIGKAGNQSGWVRGPWTVTLSEEDREFILDEFATLDMWAQHRPTEATLTAACTCGACYPKPIVEAPRTMAQKLWEASELKAEITFLELTKKDTDAELKTLKARYKALRETLSTIAEDQEVIYTNGSMNLSHTKDGTPRLVAAK